MRTAPVASVVLAALVACRAAPPPPSPRAASAPSAQPDAAINAASDAASDAAADVSVTVAATTPRLAPHGAAVPVTGGDARVEFVGDAAQAMAAAVRRGDDVTPVEGWPVGVRVLAGASRGDGRVVALLVETVAALDRPAGLRAVLALHAGNEPTMAWSLQPAPLRWQRAARALTDAASVARLFDGDADPPYAVCESLERALARPAPTPGWVAPGALETFVAWQDGLVTARAIPSRLALAQALRGAVGAGCSPDRVELTGDVRDVRARAVLVVAPPAPAPAPAPAQPPSPARVAPSPPSAQLVAWLRARYAGDPVVVGSAPLAAAGGRVSVVVAAAFEGNLLVLEEGGVIRALPLGRGVNINDDRVTAARFLDADGDGRTDVLVESQGTEAVAQGEPQPPPRMHHRGLYLTPPPALDAPVAYDEGSVPELLGAPDLDAAATALTALPWQGVTVREACPLVQATRTLAGARRVSTAAAQLLRYEEPGAVGWRPELVPLARVTESDGWWGAAVACRNLTCDPARMVCVGRYDDPGPGGTTYWFTREGGRLRLRAVAVYAGS